MTKDQLVPSAKPHRHRTAERKGSLELHNGVYRIVALVNGQRIRKSTGTSDRELADRIRAEWMSQFTARDAIAQAEKLADAVKTAEARAEAAAKRAEDALPALRIADALEAYLGDPTRLAEQPTVESTDKNVGKHLRRFCRWVSEHYPECVEMRQFDEQKAKEYVAYLRANLSSGTCKIQLATIKRTWNVLGERARCHGNPWANLKISNPQHRRRENFTPEQIEAIFAKLKPGTELHTLCTLGRYTGLRLGDAATMKWSAVDMNANVIELVPMKVKKYGKPVRIPIHPELRTALDAMPRNGEYILPKCERLYWQQGSPLTGKISALLHSAGIETNEELAGYAHKVCKYGFHSFRHSFVTTCAEQGIPLSVVQALVGHLSSSMTDHYFHISDDSARRAIAAIPNAGATPATPAAPAAQATAGESNVSAAINALANLSKEELLTIRAKLDALLAKQP